MNDSISWFHGGISREHAVQLLERKRKHGLFLVRESTKTPGAYVLSVWHDKNGCHHFQIRCVGDTLFSIDDGPVFSGLDSLVAHYQSEADGLPARLTEFCPGTRPPSHVLKFGEDTDLHEACSRNDLEQVRDILQKSSTEVNLRNSQGWTCLHDAALKGNENMIELLLSAGADVKSRDINDLTALQCACVNGHPAACSQLIQAGSDVQDRCPTSGFVPLHYAAMYGPLEVVKVLIASGATLHPRTPEGDTPRDLALRYGHLNIAEYIENFPVPPPKTNATQWLHENLSRKNAVELLTIWGMSDGLFLVRSSSRENGLYVLSMAAHKQCFHFEIRSRSDRWFYIDDGPLFETLPHVIDHYSKCADGLPLLLQNAIPLSGPPVLIGRDKVISQGSPADRSSGRKTSSPLPAPYSGGHERGRINRAISQQNARPSFHRSESSPDTTDGQTNNAKMPARRPPPPLPSEQARSPPPKSLPIKRQAPPPPPPRQEPQQQTLILRSSLEMDKELGQGEFGSVIRGTWTDPKGNKIEVALKTLHPEKISSGEPEFLREARVMSGLDHPCIVRLIGVCLGPPLILVQELVSMGALLDYLIDFQQDILTADLKLWAAQIAWGMTYLEKKRFVHRDLATRNILLKTKDQLKISDFGLSRAVGTGSDYYKASQGGRWPVKWYAPESINYGTFSHKSDVWSYGVTLWEMYSFGQLPYGDMSGAEVIKLLETEGRRLEKPDDCPDHIYSLMLKCWDLTPDKRPTFSELHKIFSTDPLYADVKLPTHLAEKWKS